jgi:hypothetical protein
MCPNLYGMFTIEINLSKSFIFIALVFDFKHPIDLTSRTERNPYLFLKLEKELFLYLVSNMPAIDLTNRKTREPN